LDELSREQKMLLLKRLRSKLASLVAAFTAKQAGAPITKACNSLIAHPCLIMTLQDSPSSPASIDVSAISNPLYRNRCFWNQGHAMPAGAWHSREEGSTSAENASTADECKCEIAGRPLPTFLTHSAPACFCFLCRWYVMTPQELNLGCSAQCHRFRTGPCM
jgi:hypothetical protein